MPNCKITGINYQKIFTKELSTIGYRRVMDYLSHFGWHRLGGSEKVSIIGDYGLRELWIKGESTVPGRV